MKKTFISFIAIFCLTMSLNAQLWIPQGAGFTTPGRGIMNIFAVNSQVVWVSSYDGSGSGQPSQDVSVTTNGGTTWHPKNVNAGTGLGVDMICAVDSLTAWVSVYKASGSLLPGIFKTTNGGNTWTRQPTAAYNTTSFPDIVYFWDADTGVTIGDANAGKFEIYTTSNGGTTWTVVPAANIPAPFSGDGVWSSNYSVVSNTIWLSNGQGRILKSADNGHHWTIAALPGMTGKNVTPAFRDVNNGFGVKFYSGADTSNVLDASSDGGASYTPFAYSGSVFTQGVAYVKNTPDTYVSVGEDYINQPTRLGFTYSFDGGVTWVTDPTMHGTQLTYTQWVNDSTGWAGAFSSGPTDGLWKFNNVLALQSAFMTNDSSILVSDSAHFQNLSLGRLTSYNWTFQNGNPSASTLKNPVVQYLMPGSWDVTLTVTGALGSNTLVKHGYIHVGTVGIHEHSKFSITVYPNPVKDVLNINATGNMQEVQVMNIFGQTILDRKINNTVMLLNSTELKSGLYTLKVKMEDGDIFTKFVVR
jgi:PKD repeat protein